LKKGKRRLPFNWGIKEEEKGNILFFFKKKRCPSVTGEKKGEGTLVSPRCMGGKSRH